MIITDSYFTGDIYIPQVGSGASNIANDKTRLQNAIDKYEVEILVKGLGRKLCKEFYDQIDPNTRSIKTGVSDAKWGLLLNGDEYTDGGKDYFWRGLVDKTGNLTESLMAYYIYFHYVREGQKSLTTQGTKKGKAQNTTGTDANEKMVSSWRSLHKWYSGYSDDVCKGFYVYKGIFVEDYFINRDNSNDVDLYRYLTHKKADFPDWRFTGIGENMNEMGI